MLKSLNLLIFLIFIFNLAHSAERQPLEYYYAETNHSDTIIIYRLSFLDGSVTAIDSIDTTDPSFPDHDINWRNEIDLIALYDAFNKRVFFQENQFAVPSRTHVYDANLRRYYSLPFENYGRLAANIFVSPMGQYILTGFQFKEGEESSDNNQTTLLNGKDLSQIGDRKSMSFGLPNFMTIITGNNKYLLNLEYLPNQEEDNSECYIIYSLPDLRPIDTLFKNAIGWQGRKMPLDYYDDGILLSGKVENSSEGMEQGNYLFTVSVPNIKITSKIIKIKYTPDEDPWVYLTPEKDEILALYSVEGMLRRYSLSDGKLLGEIEIPIHSYRGFFGNDGYFYFENTLYPNLWLESVDYKNNYVIRNIELKVPLKSGF